MNFTMSDFILFDYNKENRRIEARFGNSFPDNERMRADVRNVFLTIGMLSGYNVSLY
ncbi:hypothetical protein SAMN05428988_4113 [Chitinophaga sp. YR573]|nr:hypothetical protein SAMN05428988_4113 [Chitinophaga sp. YR573]